MPSTRPCWASDFPAPSQTASGPAMKRREVRPPRPEAARQDHVPQSHPGMHVARADPEPKPAPYPVHRSEHEAHQHPTPVQPQKWCEEDIDPIAESNQVIANEECDSAEGNDGEQLYATTEETRGQR